MVRKSDGAVLASCPSPDRAEEIRTQLERVLASHQFRGSRRCQSLLRHITEQALAGDALDLKERNLGIAVFGRSPDYDTREDPVVRATASEIRKKLALYYQEEAHEAEPRIELLSGSYIPEFQIIDTPSTPTVKRRSPFIMIAASILAILAISAIATVWHPWRHSDLDSFWSPVLQAPGAVLISIGQPVALNLVSAQEQDKIQAIEGSPQAKESVTGSIPRKDLIILRDRYVALGDAICLARLASLFQKYNKGYIVRGGRSTTAADLHEHPAVLIAAFDNQWTLRQAGQLRFTFVKDSAHDTDMVRDRLHPENTAWKLTGAWPNWDVANDYAIVSRILDVNTDRPVVIAAGITEYGTGAAGEFLGNPEYFSEAVSQLPRDWKKRNLQIVLRVPVVHGASGHPRVLATHVW